MQNHWFKRYTKITISLIYFCVMTLVRGMLRVFGRPPRRRLVVLYYHGVSSKFRLDFQRQMCALQRRARVVPADFQGQLPPDKQPVAITFDDAFDNLLENALPELAQRGFHATIFVPVGWMGLRPTWATDGDDFDADDAVMTIDQVKSLSSPLISLGAHTINHLLLSNLDKETIRHEVEGSRKRLSEISGRDIRYFSFPYGDHNPSCVDACKAAGYEFAFSILPEEVDTACTKILRGRTRVDPSDGPIEFYLKFNGAYVWTSAIAPIWRKIRSVSLLFGRANGEHQVDAV